MKAYRILIAEDDDDIMSIYQQTFESLPQVNCDFFMDGRIAIEAIKQNRYDCIILDIKMPGASGFQVASEIRESETNQATPIFIVSGNITPTNRAISKNYALADLISKPFNLRQFSERVLEVLKSRKRVYHYDSKIINIFIQSSKAIIEHFFAEPILVGRPKIKPNGFPARGYITATIPLSGDGFIGTMAISCNVGFAERIVEGAFRDMVQPKYTDDVAADAMSELCNQIAGRVKTNFSKKNQKIKIGLPLVVIGKGHRFYHKIQNPVLFMPMGKDKMGCDMEFCLDAVDLDLDQQKAAESADMEEGMVFFD